MLASRRPLASAPPCSLTTFKAAAGMEESDTAFLRRLLLSGTFVEWLERSLDEVREASRH